MMTLLPTMIVIIVILLQSVVQTVCFKSSVTYLETNCWLYKTGKLTILVDPVLASPLDFGIPFLYKGEKKVINGPELLKKLSSEVDYVLISQGIDDHAHKPTLTSLNKLNPTMRYIAPPSSIGILQSCGITNDYIDVISPGNSITVSSKKDFKSKVDITATGGALLGPPWQAKENGYLFKSSLCPTLYYEPHCMFDKKELEDNEYTADYILSPIVAQELPYYTLVDGMEKVLDLATTLKTKNIIPFGNNNLKQSGVLSKLVTPRGSLEEFSRIVQNYNSNRSSKTKLNVLNCNPGIEVEIV